MEIDLLITNARIHTRNPENLIIDPGEITIDQGKILEVAPQHQLKQKYSPKRLWDASGKVILPGFINSHNHLFQVCLRGLGRDLHLIDWVNQGVRPALPYYDQETLYWAAMNGCVEAIRSGTTTMLDYMYAIIKPELCDPVIQAMIDTGIRGILGRGICDFSEMPWGEKSKIYEPIDVSLGDIERLMNKYGQNKRIKIALAPSVIWNMTAEGLKACADFAHRNSLLVSMHSLETVDDDEYAIKKYGKPLLPLLQEIGFLNSNFLLVHGVHIQAKDIEMLKRHNVKISHNPVSNMILASGVAPIPALRSAGIKVSLATDGAASNDSQSMIEVMKTTALLHKVHNLNAALVSAQEVMQMATSEGAEALKMEKEIGSLEAGKCADFVVFDMFKPNTQPCHDDIAALVYSGSGVNVHSVVIDGKFVFENGSFISVNEEEVLKQVANHTCQLLERSKTNS
jgi:5-methylthioadenosine/S-adenosylhomocysteine deaminase